MPEGAIVGRIVVKEGRNAVKRPPKGLIILWRNQLSRLMV